VMYLRVRLAALLQRAHAPLVLQDATGRWHESSRAMPAACVVFPPAYRAGASWRKSETTIVRVKDGTIHLEPLEGVLHLRSREAVTRPSK
jgi:hypothetical protein